jgi:hypothetical protein
VRLAFVLAGAADLLPEEGHGVQAQDVRPHVGPVEDDVDHLDEHGRVPVVEVPLVGVEHGHDPLAHGLVPGEVAGGRGREDLGHGLLVGVGDAAVVEDVVVVLVLLLPCPGAYGPFVLIGGVVDHDVQDQEDFAAAQGAREVFDVVEGAVPVVDPAEVAHGVAAVVVFPGAVEDGHDMDHVHPELLDVGKPLLETLQVVGEAVAIQGHADPFLAQEPVVVDLAGDVRAPQDGSALDVAQGQGFHQPDHLVLEVGPLAVEQLEQGIDGVEIRPEARVEAAQPVLADFRAQLGQNLVQQRMGSLFVHQFSLSRSISRSHAPISGQKWAAPSRMPAA